MPQKLLTLENTSEDTITIIWDGTEYSFAPDERMTLDVGVAANFKEREPDLAVVAERTRTTPDPIVATDVTVTNTGEVALDLSHDGQTYHFEPSESQVFDASVADSLIIEAAEGGGTMSIETNGGQGAQILPPEPPTSYVITATAGEGGSIDPEGAVNVDLEDHQDFTITPDEHYAIDDVLVDDVSIGAEDSYTFTNVDEEHTIEASFAIITHTITATAGAHGSISPTGATSVDDGDNQVFTVTPSEGYVVDTVTVDGDPAVLTDDAYTFTDVTEDHTIAVTFVSE